MTFIHTTGPRARQALALLVAMVAAGLVLVPSSHASKPRGKYDRAFMTEMVSHHGMAVDMAEMAMEKSTHPELKQLAESIVRTQSAEIKQMQRWLRSWYGVTVRPRMTEQDMQDMKELEDASGAAFELRFMSLMTVHHTLAIERAGIATHRARHAKLRKLARGIVKAQEREIAQFRAWTVAWYAN